MSHRQALEVQFEDRTANKWSLSLREDVFDSFISQGGNTTLHKAFGHGSLFSPLLFGKFFDPSDAFPLWDFESEIFLSGIRSSVGCSVDWFVADTDYVLKAEVPGLKKYDVQIYVENGKVMEISGQWRRWEASGKDWRSGHWWEYGYVRRIELPENANWRKMEASIDADNRFLEIKIPKHTTENSNMPPSTDVEPKDSQII